MQFINGQRHVITDHSQCEDDDGVVTCPDDNSGEISPQPTRQGCEK